MLLCLSLLAHAQERRSATAAILEMHGNRGGFAVYVGQEAERIVSGLSRKENYSVHALCTDENGVGGARALLKKAGLYGRSSAEYWPGGELPYIENLVSLLILDKEDLVDREEILRVLSPNGLALVRNGEEWKEIRKPANPETDTWPQYFYGPENNPVSKDKLVAPPRHLQWRGSPRWGRFHEKMSSFAAMVSTNGRVFYIMDEGSPASIFFRSNWQLTARDAYNGTVLWKKPISTWVNRFFSYKAGPATAPRRLAATDEFVYVTLGIKAPVSQLEAKTGRLVKTYAGTETTDEIILSDNMLLAVVRPELTIPTSDSDLAINRAAGGLSYDAQQNAHLKAFDRESGKQVWQIDSPLTPLGVAADDTRVYICDFEKVRGFDRARGTPLWDSESLPVPKKYRSSIGPRLTVKDGVLLFAGSENVMKKGPERGWSSPSDTLTALSSKTGETLWSTDDHPASGFHSPEDLFVIHDTVWFGATKDGKGKGTMIGLDLKTGAEKSRFEPDDNSSYWWHQRCYPQKATEKYLITSRTGIEYVDYAGKHWELNHWIRGACTYGVMPANGLTYAPQHPCACYPESKLSGMNVMAATQRYSLDAGQNIERLEKGPDYSTTLDTRMAARANDWPLLRGDASRSGFSRTRLSGTPKQLWSTRVSGSLTSLIAGGGMLFTADKTTHTVFALNAADGKELWRFTANGRVDSPPAYACGRVVFGSRDGYVYCLNAETGELCWRFMAATRNKRLFNFEQLESVWPVFGSVLIIDQAVYFTAGRSLFHDSGIALYKLDLASGKIIVQKQLDHIAPDGKNYHTLVENLSMPASNNEVLSSDGKHIFMNSQIMTMDGTRIMQKPGARHDADQYSHIFSPNGLLDGSWWHRGYYAYGNGVSGGAGWSVTMRRAITGKILCVDDENIYSFGRESKYKRWTLPLEFQLASTSKTKPKLPKSDDGQKAGQGKKTTGRNSANPYPVNWQVKFPMLVRAMFITDNAVVIAGPRDLYDEEKAVAGFKIGNEIFSDQQEHMAGKHGSLLKVINKRDGSEISSVALPYAPTWDGMITANGRIYMTTVDGHLVCLVMADAVDTAVRPASQRRRRRGT